MPQRKGLLWALLGVLVGIGLSGHVTFRPLDWRLSGGSTGAEPAAEQPRATARVLAVIDGDTFTIAGGEKVRVLSVDTPEMASEDQPLVQPMANEARLFASALLEGSVVELETDGPDRDHHGRLLRHVWIDGDLLSERLVAAGLGRSTPRAESPLYRSRLEAAETAARAARKGIWGVADVTPLAVFSTPSGPPVRASQEASVEGGAGFVSGTVEVASEAPGGVDTTRPCGERVRGALTAAAAEARPGEHATVEFRVVRTFDSGNVTFLNSRDPYQGRFYVAIFPDEYGAFPDPPAIYLDGRCVAVRGRVEIYRGSPQIVLQTADDLRVVGD